ncbi:MAG: hypothetical protein ABSC90_02795 [Acidimicrobiales bacterium]
MAAASTDSSGATSGSPDASSPSSSALAFTGNGPYAPYLVVVGLALLAVGDLTRRWLVRRRST